MWLVRRLAPDFKTIADFRKDNGAAIQSVCRQFVELCRRLKLFTCAVVAIDGSKFKAVNNRDKNYTVAKVIPARRRSLSRMASRGSPASIRQLWISKVEGAAKPLSSYFTLVAASA